MGLELPSPLQKYFTQLHRQLKGRDLSVRETLGVRGKVIGMSGGYSHRERWWGGLGWGRWGTGSGSEETVECWNETKDQSNGEHKSWDKRADREWEKCRGGRENEMKGKRNEIKWNKKLVKMEWIENSFEMKQKIRKMVKIKVETKGLTGNQKSVEVTRKSEMEWKMKWNETKG